MEHAVIFLPTVWDKVQLQGSDLEKYVQLNTLISCDVYSWICNEDVIKYLEANFVLNAAIKRKVNNNNMQFKGDSDDG